MTGISDRGAASRSRESRGQTPHDYLIGVSLLLITLFGVFALVPGMFQPFAQPVDAGQDAAAERIGERLVTHHAIEGSQNTIDGEVLQDTLTDDTAFQNTLAAAGVNTSLQFVNVTVSHPDGTRLDTSWSGYPPDSMAEYHVNTTTASSTVRVVDAEGIGGCEPVCRIVVRVW